MLKFPLRVIQKHFSLRKTSIYGLALLCLLPATVHAELDPYSLFIAKNVYQVYGDKKPHFLLRKKGKGGIALHGESEQQMYQTLNCEKEMSIEIHSYQRAGKYLTGKGKVGNISASICKYNDVDRGFAVKNQKNVQQILEKLPIDKEAKENAERTLSQFKIDKIALDNNAEMYTFPVLFFGHGLLIAHTAIAYPSDNDFILVIQYVLNDIYCEEDPDVRICSDPENSLKEVVQLLLSKWPQQ